MYPTLKPSQRNAILGSIDPQSSVGAVSTGWISFANFLTMMAVVKVGAISAGGTVNAALQQAQDNAGTGAKAINSPQGVAKAITALTQAGGNSNEQCLLNVRQDEMGVNNGFTFVRLTITPSGAAALVSGDLWGLDPQQGTADLHAAASQVQIV